MMREMPKKLEAHQSTLLPFLHNFQTQQLNKPAPFPPNSGFNAGKQIFGKSRKKCRINEPIGKQ